MYVGINNEILPQQKEKYFVSIVAVFHIIYLYVHLTGFVQKFVYHYVYICPHT